MITRAPNNFVYSKNTSNLFLFYQCVNEMSFNYSPDSYKAPILNTASLCDELLQTYQLLLQNGLEEELYSKNIPIIVDELEECLSKDGTAKKLLGLRYDSTKESLKQIRDINKHLDSTVRNIQSHFRNKAYISELKNRLIELVTGEKNQNEIIITTGIWVTELIRCGYSKEHIYHTTTDFFQDKTIDEATALKDYLEIFDFVAREWIILLLIDNSITPYLQELGKILNAEDIAIELFAEEDIKKVFLKDGNKHIDYFYKSFKSLQQTKKVSCIKVTIKALDPYRALDRTVKYITTLMNIVSLYDNVDKHIYPYTLCLNYSKISIVSETAMRKRNRRYSQNYIPAMLKMISNLRVSRNVLRKLLSVFDYHGDALAQENNEKYVITMLWTSLEELFIDGNIKGSKGSIVKNSLIEIIQRTIIIKRIKYLQSDMLRHLKSTKKELIEKCHIEDLEQFLNLLFMKETDEPVLEIMATLEGNPLLRTRIYNLIEVSLSSGKHIKQFLDQHRRKIDYQIERIYRSRNFLVHAGVEMRYGEKTIECLHYYVDFVINYILAKLGAGESVIDIYDVVDEARSDNRGHMAILEDKSDVKTTIENYKVMLFGPSCNILRYYRDHEV